MIPATIPLFSPIPPKNTDIHRNEELHTSTSLRHRENWVSQGFQSDQCDSCISPENGEFDVRWVRFPKHIWAGKQREHPVNTKEQVQLHQMNLSANLFCVEGIFG